MAINLRQLAKLLNLSPTTVSRALAGYSDVSDGTRLRVREIAKKHKYFPNPVAQRLQKGKTETIGLALSPGYNYFKDSFFIDLLAGVSSNLSKIGYDLTIAIAADSNKEIESLKRMVQGKRVDGIILTMTKVNDDRISYLIDQDFPFVLYGRTEDSRPHSFVDMDGELVFREACKLLFELGHKRIALINGEHEYMFPKFCLEGYKNALRSEGINFDPELVKEWKQNEEKCSSFQHTLSLMKIEKPPTAIISYTEVVPGILQALQQINLKVGEDVSLICYEDLEIAKTNIPQLTTMCPPMRSAAKKLVEFLIEIIEGNSPEKPQKIFNVEMIIRQSTNTV